MSKLDKKIAVFAGDLFWSSIPYDSLNVYREVSKQYNCSLVMFENDLRLTKKFSGNEKFYFDKSLFASCSGLRTVRNWNDFKLLTNDYDAILSGPKLFPKTRRPGTTLNDVRPKWILWDIGGADILTDCSSIRPYSSLVKGPLWKSWCERIYHGSSAHIVGSTHYDYYYDTFSGVGKPISCNEFFKKYELDVSKSTLLIAPSNPSSHTSQLLENMKHIDRLIDLCEKNRIQILLKTYPHDYVYHEKDGQGTGVYKRQSVHSSDKSQFQFFDETYRTIKVIESQDHFSAIKYSDYLFNMSGSHIAWETVFSKCRSFSMNYSSQKYFGGVGYLPAYIKFPDDIVNAEIQELDTFISLKNDQNDLIEGKMSPWISKILFENQVNHALDKILNNEL